jgi:hypothetical protein
MDLPKVGCDESDWFHLTQGIYRRWYYTHTITWAIKNFRTSWALLHGVSYCCCYCYHHHHHRRRRRKLPESSAGYGCRHGNVGGVPLTQAIKIQPYSYGVFLSVGLVTATWVSPTEQFYYSKCMSKLLAQHCNIQAIAHVTLKAAAISFICWHGYVGK